jgi:hypothetical protein
MYLTEHWRLKEQRYRLMGSIPDGGDKVTFPPRPIQPREVAPYDFLVKEESDEGDRVALQVLASDLVVKTQD